MSAWEIALKTALGKLRPRRTVAQAITDRLTVVTRAAALRQFAVPVIVA